MSHRWSRFAVPAAAFVGTMLFAPLAAHAKEMKGAAILAHPCGKVAVEHMALVDAGKMKEAAKLGSESMQEEWAALPEEDREMMTGMMKEMSMTREAFSKSIEESGAMMVEAKSATLTIVKETKDENGTSTESITQNYEIAGDVCRITR